MKIKKVIFEKSSSDIDSCPKTKLFEIAFIGRSNVGKSSILNMLLNKKGVAKVSKTPGKTKLINYFLVNDNLYFVDLPGYGYANAKKGNGWQGRLCWDIKFICTRNKVDIKKKNNYIVIKKSKE